MRPICGNKTDEFFSLAERKNNNWNDNKFKICINIYNSSFLVMFVVFYNSYYERKYCEPKFDYLSIKKNEIRKNSHSSVFFFS